MVYVSLSLAMFKHAETNLLSFNTPGHAPESERVLIHVVTILSLAVIAHFLVWTVRFISDWLIQRSSARKMPVGFVTQKPKFITLTGLIASALTFAIYFTAIGFVLDVFKVNLTAYLATASVIGLAVGFGSQGLVQDVVTGLTLIFSDTLDVGDLIEVAGKIGRVERVGLRFTELTNFYNQQVFVPNRIIADISRFPQGGIHAYADVQIPPNLDGKKAMELVTRIAKGMWVQFSAIILSEPELSEAETVKPASWNFVRVQFRLWPGQGSLIETTFRQWVIEALKALDPGYADWRVTVTYRASARKGIRGLA